VSASEERITNGLRMQQCNENDCVGFLDMVALRVFFVCTCVINFLTISGSERVRISAPINIFPLTMMPIIN